MYKQVESPRFAVCIRIVELVLLTSLTSAEHLLIHKHWTINCAIVLYCIVSIYLPAPSASHSRSLSFTLRSINPCALFHHNSPGLLPIPLLWLAFCSPGQPKPCSSLCGTSHKGKYPNLVMCQVTCWRSFTGSQSGSVWNTGSPRSLVWRCQLSLAPTYLIDLCRPVSGSRSSRSLRSSERGLLSVPFACTAIMQSRACSVVAPTVWNSLPPALRLLPRTLSDTFYMLE